jgi:hypothetical protein
MRTLLPLTTALLLVGSATAQQATLPHGPFTGVYHEDFEDWSVKYSKCQSLDVGEMCTANDQLIYANAVVSAYCTKSVCPSWLMSILGNNPSFTLDFPEPMQRFGGWFVNTGQDAAKARFTFFDALGEPADVRTAELPTCSWTWIGWQAVEGSGFSSVRVVVHGDTNLIAVDDLAAEPFGHGPLLGDPTCSGAPNSTGRAASLAALGSPLASGNALVLEGSDLPPQQVGCFLASRSEARVEAPGGSLGTLCLGAPVLRLAGIATADEAGRMARQVNTQAVTDLPPVAIEPGETWTFQAWYRDAGLGGSGSNFTGAIRVTFE